MQSKFRKRLVYLIISVLVVIILFGISVRRASEDSLIPTPTFPVNPVTYEGMMTSTKTGLSSSTPVPDITSTLIQPSLTNTEILPSNPATREIDSMGTAQTGMYNATQRARIMSNIIKGLYTDKSISSIEGYYSQLEEYSITFNKPGYFNVSFTDYRPTNFVIRANVLWNNAGEEISYPTAGCGFVFGYQDIYNQNRVILTLDGNVRIQNISDSITTQPDPTYYGELDRPEGHANLILAVENGWITMYVNNQLVTRVQDENIHEGWLGYAIEAGSSYSYGTSCDFMDIELWEIEENE